MAQKPNNNEEFLKKNATTGFKSLPSGPKQMKQSISFSKKNGDDKAYRGITLIQNPLQTQIQGGIANFNQGKLIGKNEQSNKEYVQGKVTKETEYKIIDVPELGDLKMDVDVDPWDGLSPLKTYSSSKYTPKEMIKFIKKAFDNLINNDNYDIDYEQYSEYTFEGRTYTLNGELEFRITIFSRGKASNKNTKSEVEIRRMSGDCFAMGDAESKFIDELLKQNCIDEDQGSDIGTLKLNSFTECGFSLNPLPFNMPDTDSDTTLDDEFTSDNAIELIKDATNKNQYQDSYTLACQDFFDECKNSEHIKIIIKQKDVVETLLNSIKEDCYDAFAIKTILDCINLLIKADAKYNEKIFKSSLIAIRNTWSKTVENVVGKARFKFPKSQVIMRKCEKLLRLKK